MFHCNIINLRLPFDSNRNIFTFQSHKNKCAFFRSVQTRHFLYVIVPPGGKTYQAGLAIFSSKEVNLRDIVLSPGNKMSEGRREEGRE